MKNKVSWSKLPEAYWRSAKEYITWIHLLNLILQCISSCFDFSHKTTKMSTPILWQAIRLNQLFSKFYLIPHPVIVDPHENEWSLIPKYSWKLLPHYINNFLLIFPISLIIIFYNISKYIWYPEKVKHGSLTTLFDILWLGFIIISLSFNIIIFFEGDRLISYFNKLLKVEQQINTKSDKLKFKNINQSIVYLLIAELKSLLNNPASEDFIGLIATNLVIYGTLLPFFTTILLLYTNLDSYGYFIQDVILWISSAHQQTQFESNVIFMIRLLLLLIVFLENCRTNIIVLVSMILHQVIFNNCVNLLKFHQFDQNTLKNYKHIIILINHSYWFSRPLAGVLLFTGYFICVLLNCCTIFAWKFLPISIYISLLPVTPLAYSLVSKGH